MLRFVDPDATTTVEVEGVTFTIGYWPPREAEGIAAGFNRLRQMPDKDSPEAWEYAAGLYRRMVQYGVRGWIGWEGAPEPVLEDVEIHGRKYRRLDQRLLDGVSLSGALMAVARACLDWNTFTVEEKKTPEADPSPVAGSKA